MRYESKTKLFGLPLVSIALGPNKASGENRGVARGVLAIGDVSLGVVSFGAAAGGTAIGYNAVGGLTIAARHFEGPQVNITDWLAW